MDHAQDLVALDRQDEGRAHLRHIGPGRLLAAAAGQHLRQQLRAPGGLEGVVKHGDHPGFVAGAEGPQDVHGIRA